MDTRAEELACTCLLLLLVLTGTHFCPFGGARFIHYVMKQSRCKNAAALLRKMPLLWWKCIKVTGGAEANVSSAAGHDAALSNRRFNATRVIFIEFCHWSSKKATAPPARQLSLKANNEISFFPVFLWEPALVALLTLFSLHELLCRPRRKIWQ